MVGFERNAKSLTSLTSLTGADFRVVTGWGGARAQEAGAIEQDMDGFVTGAIAALTALTGRKSVGRFRFGGQSYRVLRTGMGYIQILASSGRRLIATNSPAHGYGFFA